VELLTRAVIHAWPIQATHRECTIRNLASWSMHERRIATCFQWPREMPAFVIKLRRQLLRPAGCVSPTAWLDSASRSVHLAKLSDDIRGCDLLLFHICEISRCLTALKTRSHTPQGRVSLPFGAGPRQRLALIPLQEVLMGMALILSRPEAPLAGGTVKTVGRSQS
jgi:hypothetical protein